MEKRFNNCVSSLKANYRLAYDFFLEDYNMIIEFDGEQHFKPRFNNHSFKQTIINDNIKNNYILKPINNIEHKIRSVYSLQVMSRAVNRVKIIIEMGLVTYERRNVVC
jgi:very-short-patch-repair endonuclease